MPVINQDHLYEINVPESGEIDPVGQAKIQSFLVESGYSTLPQNWNWQWMVHSKLKEGDSPQYVGTLPKRISSFFFKERQTNLPQNVMTIIGNLASQSLPESNRYMVDFSLRYDWESGSFGDDNSCYFERGGLPLQILLENDVYAARFYTPEDDVKKHYKSRVSSTTRANFFYQTFGLGRAWLINNFPKPDSMTIFNGYWKEKGKDGLRIIARALSLLFGMSYKQVSAYNNGESAGIVYINNSARYEAGVGVVEKDSKGSKKVHKPRAFVIGTQEVLGKYGDTTGRVDFRFKLPESMLEDED